MLYERTALSKQPDELVKQGLAVLRDRGDMTPAMLLKAPYIPDFASPLVFPPDPSDINKMLDRQSDRACQSHSSGTRIRRIDMRIITIRVLQLTTLAGAAAFMQLHSTAQSTPLASQDPLQATFEVVSIHPMRRDDIRSEHIDNPYRRGYLKAVNVKLKSLMEIAYDIPDLRMIGGPNWLASDRFSLEAKTDARIDEILAVLPAEQAKQAKRKMITALLVQRFKLAIHMETREMSVFAMVIAKGGPKLAGSQDASDSQVKGDQLIDIEPGSDTLQILAYELSWRVGRPVLDRTGLQDNQALQLRWRGDEGAQMDSNEPSLFTAIQEQLGLKLNPTKGSVPVLVIDHAESPTEN